MITQTYNLNLIPNGVNVVVDASQYDKGSRTIVFNLCKGSEVFNVPAGSDVYVLGTKLDKTGYEYSCSFTNNQVSFDIEQQMTVLAGKHDAEIRIMKDGDILGTANFVFNIERAGLEDDTVISETELPTVEYIVELAEEGKIMEKVDDTTVGDIAIFDENGQVYDSGVPIGMIKPVYGVRRSLASADSAWERIGDNVDKVANATHDGTAVTNDFDSIYPWSDIITVNMADDGTINAEIGDANFKFDGSNGEVMTYIPPFYYSRYQKDGYEYIHISKNYFGGAELSEGFYIGRYTTSSGVHSKSGVQSQVSQNITTFRTQATGKGTGWQQLDYHYFLLQLLYLVEYADYNSQSKLGNGVSSVSAQVNSGALDSLGMKSGCLANAGATSVIYRGIENIFGNIWQFVDGLNIKDNVAYICYKPSSYAVDTFTGDYSVIGYTNATENGNPKTLGMDNNNSLIALPTSVGGSSTTYICDYYWQNTGNRIALVGGAWTSGANGGLFYWSLYNDSGGSDTSIGSRLLKI